MVEITDSLACLFTGEVEERDGDHVVTVPSSEIEHETVTPGETYRVALIQREGGADTASTESAANASPDRDVAGNGAGTSEARTTPTDAAGPPVSEGDVREVTIETLGDKGDGIAKIERGYVVIVPDSQPGDEPTVEITSVRENVSFAEVVGE
ncbi:MULTISPECIES: TRAM domain-containing protein [unclassified Halorubrum]|uniref:TRAM domain-containing protein n=1 Tax=unclassified Halorubrum TaxID=2642239 RepID=UPI000B9934A2|nr:MULTISPECIES: TRAM domain-containing protein [unclassified Halorubrum]OYR43220.1 deoxyribonuclease [Halorubrum sp. Eb13]OYR50251.1 deoxyribonuclease [Halorubrum sp. Ea1]